MRNRVIVKSRETALAVLAALVLVGGAARAAQGIPAGDLDDTDPPPYGSAPPPTSSSCSSPKNKWATPPRVVIHLSEFKGSPTQTSDLMIDAIRDVVGSFNEMGATRAAVQTPLYTSSDPFILGKWFGGDTPKIHVGFADAATWAATVNVSGAAGVTTTAPRLTADGCYFAEMHILFPNVGVQLTDEVSLNTPWTFGSPPSQVNAWYHAFYDAGVVDGSFSFWFRPLFLHELLHAFGLGHTNHDYSFMNNSGSGGFPWANRSTERRIRPLPYEIGLLRDLYADAAAGTVYDISVLNTWFEPVWGSADPNAAALQLQLCSPSLGSDWSPSVAGWANVAGMGPRTCGVDGNQPGAQTGCEGDTLRTRFTVANASNARVDLTARLWLSDDEVLDSNKDIESHTVNFKNNVAAEKSVNWEAVWKLPAMAKGAPYYAIVQVTSTPSGVTNPDPASVRTDWIPLTGTFRAAACDPVPLLVNPPAP